MIPRALTIAGSDSGGGAGIQADLKTFAVLGVWGMSALTSVTVQNTEGVTEVSDVPSGVVAAQIRAIALDIGVDAAKTGMLSSADIIEAVADAVEEMGIRSLVIDPVFVSKHGDALLQDDAVDATSRRDMQEAATAILDLGAGAVLVKGGHLEGDADDLLAERRGGLEWIRGERIDTRHTHGTGCVLSAAIAAHLARGAPLAVAVRAGKEFVTEAIRHGLAIGRGIGPVNPGWALQREPR